MIIAFSLTSNDNGFHDCSQVLHDIRNLSLVGEEDSQQNVKKVQCKKNKKDDGRGNNVIDLLESSSDESENEDIGICSTSANIPRRNNQCNKSCSSSSSDSTIDLMSNFERQETVNYAIPPPPPVDTIDLTSPSSSEQNSFLYDLNSDSDNTIDLLS